MLLAAAPAFADDAPPKLDTGDTAWMLASTALVLLMTIPGLALFYAGMVRKKNILATMMQSFAICLHRHHRLDGRRLQHGLHHRHRAYYVGDFSRFMLNGICGSYQSKATIPGVHPGVGHQGRRRHGDDDPRDRLHDVPDDLRDHHPGADRRRVRRPHEVLRAVHLHDAVVAAGLFAGRALGVGADRLGRDQTGVLDFAGGTVVHINAGIAGLVCAWCWASASATAPTTWRRTTWPTR